MLEITNTIMLNIYEWDKTDRKTKTKILNRAMTDMSSVENSVRKWIDVIRTEGDNGIVKYVRQFDKKDFVLKNCRVKKNDIQEAYKKVSTKVVDTIKRQVTIARKNALSRAQQETVMQTFVPGVQVGYKITPIESAGLAVPAGQVPLPTVMQILTVNAKAAGVPRVVACYPPTGEYPEMLIAADMAGRDEK